MGASPLLERFVRRSFEVCDAPLSNILRFLPLLREDEAAEGGLGPEARMSVPEEGGAAGAISDALSADEVGGGAGVCEVIHSVSGCSVCER